MIPAAGGSPKGFGSHGERVLLWNSETVSPNLRNLRNLRLHDVPGIAGLSFILRMGKDLRRGEEDSIARTLEAEGIPILSRLSGDARAEGGDLLWVDHDTVAVGLGFRTNTEGLRQLQDVLQSRGWADVPDEAPSEGVLKVRKGERATYTNPYKLGALSS